MSWRNGTQLFGEIWPLIRVHIPDRTQRQEFLRQLLAILLEWDVDPDTVADMHTEVRTALVALGAVVGEPAISGDDVAACVRQMSNPNEKERVTAAQAIAFFVQQADNPRNAAVVALQALVDSLQDESVKVRRAAAKSIDDLLADGFALSGNDLKRLKKVGPDKDEVVKKRVASALKRAEKLTK
jgi:HEAT repeat protein